MSRRLLAVLGLAVFALGARPAAADECDILEQDLVSAEIIVEMKPLADIGAVALRHGCIDREWIPQLEMGLLLWPGDPATTDMGALRDEIAADPDVAHAELHEHVEDPEGVQRTIGSIIPTVTPAQFTGQSAATLTHVAQAQLSLTGRLTTIAVVDTGVSASNPELASVLVSAGFSVFPGETSADVPPNGVDDDGDGNIDEAYGHGTHVAGLIHLVAPDARILPIRVLNDDGKGTSFSLARGIVAAADANVDVINLSMGLPHDARAVERAIEYAATRNVAVVAAAGNRGLQCVDFPADRIETIGVAAVDDAFVKPAWASCGDQVALSAPGVGTLSTHDGTNWSEWDGSSFATPLVTGGIALLMQKYPGILPAAAKATIATCVQPDNNDPATRLLMGAGVLDLAKVADAVLVERGTTRYEHHDDTDEDEITWSPVGGATSYDVARGRCSQLSRAGGVTSLGTLTCIADDVPAGTRVTDPTLPPPGDCFFYVVRDNGTDGDGSTWGRDSDGAEEVGTSDCTP